jgi:acyl-CoA dehydrogenase
LSPPSLSLRLRQNNRPYGYRGLKIFTSLKLRFQDFQRQSAGSEIPAFALTGPQAGSDAGAMPDTGVLCYAEFEGKEQLGIRLNWEKRYITLGPVATVLGLAFKLFDPEHLLGEQEELSITVALIPTDTAGIS